MTPIINKMNPDRIETVKEVSVLIYPTVSSKTAPQKLRRYIKKTPKLLKKITKYGFGKYQQRLVHDQVRIIFEHHWGKNWRDRFKA